MTLKNGRTEVILDYENDFRNLIYEEMGLEAEMVFKEIIDGKEEEYKERLDDLYYDIDNLIDDITEESIDILTDEKYTAAGCVINRLKEILKKIESKGE